MLKFLIVLVLIFFALRMFARLFVVSTFNNLNQKMENEMKKRYPGQSQPEVPDGHISVQQTSKPKSGSTGNGGEYVDYEEVK
jgi:hypothetical protein